MFEKLITNLKNSLSSKKKAQSELDAEEGNETEDQNAELEPQQEEESASNEAPADDNAAKKRSMIIKVVVVLALVYLAVDQFILKEEPAPETVAAPAPRKKKNWSTPTPSPDATPAPVETPVATAESTPAPVETVNVVNKENPPMEPTSPPIETAPTPAPTPEVVQVPEEPVSNPVIDKPVSAVGESKQVEKQIDKEIDKLIEGENKKDDSISAKIVEKVEADAGVTDTTYVEPPTYDINGRGLVYNCKEKFWVCVDKSSFLQCTKNMKANKALKKPAECAIASVYATNEDCALVQKHNVSINAPTEFCNN
jgi:hypothetical protein